MEFEPSQINIFVGRNNTGKSSALEATSLALSATNGFKDTAQDDLLARIIHRRIPKQWSKGLAMQRYFIRLGNKEGHVYLEVDGNTLQADFQIIEEGVPESNAGDKFLEFVERYSSEKSIEARRIIDAMSRALHRRESVRQRTISETFKTIDELPFREKSFKEIVEAQKRELINDLLSYPKLFIIGRSGGEIISEVTYAIEPLEKGIEKAERYDVFFKHNQVIPVIFKMSNLNEAEEVTGLLGGLVRSNKQEEAMRLIKNDVEYFKDLREVSGELLCNLTSGTMPLSFLGDGFIALLHITFMSVLAEGGAVFVEEPETCLHPGFLDVVARQIVNSAERTQLFIATHSAELLEALLEIGKDNLELFKIVRFYRMFDGELSYEILEGKEAADEIFEIKSDLRGI